MRNITVSTTLTLVTEECYSCHTLFAMTQELKQQRLNDHGTFYCPNGHPQGYIGKSEAEKMREANKNLEQRLSLATDRATGEQRRAEAAERKAAAHKGVATKLKKRAAAGVCPCCSRHFTALERHMQNKHPEFVGEDDAA